jgi:hypothetical protein
MVCTSSVPPRIKVPVSLYGKTLPITRVEWVEGGEGGDVRDKERLTGREEERGGERMGSPGMADPFCGLIKPGGAHFPFAS